MLGVLVREKDPAQSNNVCRWGWETGGRRQGRALTGTERQVPSRRGLPIQTSSPGRDGGLESGSFGDSHPSG